MFQTDPIKLCMSLLYREEPVRKDLKELLKRRWGEIDYESEPLPFQETERFYQEMGAPLFKSFVSLTRLMNPAEIVSIKMACLNLEQKFLRQGKRLINLDPGYLDQHKVVFTYAEYAPQRILHSEGIFVDLALLFTKDKVQPLPWSYPDLKSHLYDQDFLAMRDLYRQALQDLKNVQGKNLK